MGFLNNHDASQVGPITDSSFCILLSLFHMLLYIIFFHLYFLIVFLFHIPCCFHIYYCCFLFQIQFIQLLVFFTLDCENNTE